MSRSAWIFIAACVSTLSGGFAIQPHSGHQMRMRDGIRLATNVFRPPGDGRVPAILVRTPYGKGTGIPRGLSEFVAHGYAVVVQDVRGRYDSEGVFDPLDQEGPDGDDTLNWIARQPWSDGNVGMAGGSYLGIVQWKAALTGNPHLKAIFPMVSGDDDYFDRFYSRGGALKLGHRLLWFSWNLRAPGFLAPPFSAFTSSLPLRTADLVATGRTVRSWQQALNHPMYDDFWNRLSVREHMDRVHVPVFSAGGWYDNYVESDLDAFTALGAVPEHPEHHIVIGPWAHNMTSKFGAIDFGPGSSTAAMNGIELAWFDRWLKGVASPTASAPMRIFVMGVNDWRDESEWPLARTRYTDLYLDSLGAANSLNGDGSLSWTQPLTPTADRFTYDPAKPVPTNGGAVCCSPSVFRWGPMDQGPVEKRRDILVYTSPLLDHDLEVIGPVKVILYASTTAPDTDFTAKLVDVFPSGEARNLCDGILRLRYRDGLDHVAKTSPGETYALTIPAGVTSNVFLRGHRIRLEISSSNFPRFDRNPNTGRPIADETGTLTANQTVRHGRDFPSHIVLPVVK